jgi:tetratricopeptide (TPR) repeat protein
VGDIPTKNIDPMIRLCLLFLFVCCLTLATMLQPRFEQWQGQGGRISVLAALMGDSRRLFADQFFAKADSYFHSGFYPTIFDSAKKEGPSHLKDESHEAPGGDEHEEGFLGPPRDAIEKFGRNFFPTVHTHLHNGHEREILPWLKLSADLDPSRVDTYVVAAYWLRTRLNQAEEAEEFLRQGLRANPDSYEILLELGRVYYYNKKDSRMAHNLWELALQKWHQQEEAHKKPDNHIYEEILGELVRVDQKTGDLKDLLINLEALKEVSPNKDSVQRYIDEAEAKLKSAH